MNVTVVGLWHLGAVTAACLASGGHVVIGLDFDPEVVARLQAGIPPLFEPGLAELVQQGLASTRLRFTIDSATALADADIVWVTYDTPVDAADRADVAFVVERVAQLFPHLPVGALVLISSQIPVGATRTLEQQYIAAHPNKPVTFGYSPENLRLGKAINAFTQPDRVVVGLRAETDRARVADLLRPFTERLEWMSVESAEMTKHALNAWLATSVVFINEVAALCEAVGADAKEVERGLKSEMRIGPKAYLAPGAAFAGGTLARDVQFLAQLGAAHHLPARLWPAVQASNEAHKQWARRKLAAVFGDLRGHIVAVWGLTYKPGTDTLRRSASVELCEWLAGQGARVQAHDPAVKTMPAELARKIELCLTPEAALAQAEALVVATEWPDYLACEANMIAAHMIKPLVIDANCFLAKQLSGDARIHYTTVGRAA